MIRPANREKRLGLITAYYGSPGALLDEYAAGKPQQRMRTFAQTAEDEIARAVDCLRRAGQGAILIHGPRGCAAAGGDGSTKLTEKDSIMGSERKLRAEIRHVYDELRPERIFVVTTPVVVINNDDVLSVCADMSEELGIDIKPVVTTGFKNKSPLNGIDYARLALGAGAREESGENSGNTAVSGIGDAPGDDVASGASSGRGASDGSSGDPGISVSAGLLEGKRVYIALPPGEAARYVRAVETSGGTLAGVTLDYADQGEDTAEILNILRDRGLNCHVANMQDYERANILRAAAPDLFVGETDNVLTAARLGIPCVNVSVVSSGGFASAAKRALTYGGFVRRLADAERPPSTYGSRALSRPGNWYIKPEAKL